jgi:ABC-type Mn2+/Zn2+ transport system permease subunit/Mn-dependent DtxR family transcriptional regulator
VSDILHALLVAPLHEGFFLKSLLGAGMVAIVSGVVGCLVVLRRMAFLGDALAHAMIAGVAGGYLIMKLFFGQEAHAPGMLLGSLLAAVLTVMCIGFVSRVSRVKEDTAIGIMYTGIFAGGVVLVSMFRNYIHIDLMHFIMGDVLAVGNADLWASAVSTALVLSVVVLFFRHFQLISFDPVMAASIGMPVLLLDYLLTTCVSLVVVSAVSMVGVILVVGLLITPAATAYLLSDRLDRMMPLAALFGLSSVVGGLYLCVWLDSSGGGAIMLFCTFQFLVVLVLAPRYGLLARRMRLRRMVPQQLQEDVLGALRRAPQGRLRRDELHDAVAEAGHGVVNIARAVKNMAQEGLLALEQGVLSLTEAGRAEARKLQRAHRLWETYLAHVGEPDHELHARAHELEHLKDAEAYDYLDDLLGHPEVDPHGDPIPQDPDAVRPGAETPLSLLRRGQRCTVCGLPEGGVNGLTLGDGLTMLERRDAGRLWAVRLDNGQELELEHAAADALRVRCTG